MYTIIFRLVSVYTVDFAGATIGRICVQYFYNFQLFNDEFVQVTHVHASQGDLPGNHLAGFLPSFLPVTNEKKRWVPTSA